MRRIRFLLLALFLTIMSYGCATTISKPEKLVDEKVVINSCSKIVEGASSYQHEKIRLTWLLTTEKTLDPISIEELMSICGGSKPCPRMIPMTRTKFEQYAQKQLRLFKGESIRFVFAEDGNQSTITAIIKNVKYGLAQKDRPVTTTNMYLTQTYINGKPCGVWYTTLKQQQDKAE